jgi:hypothetical protein
VQEPVALEERMVVIDQDAIAHRAPTDAPERVGDVGSFGRIEVILLSPSSLPTMPPAPHTQKAAPRALASEYIWNSAPIPLESM